MLNCFTLSTEQEAGSGCGFDLTRGNHGSDLGEVGGGIDVMTGGAIGFLRPGPYGGIKIGVRWMIGKEQFGCVDFMSIPEGWTD